jgi:hypothetical protein
MYHRTSWERLGGAAASLVLIPVGIFVPAVVAILMVNAVVVVVNVGEARRVRLTGPDFDLEEPAPA